MRYIYLIGALITTVSTVLADVRYRIGDFNGDFSPISWNASGWQVISGGIIPLGLLTSTSDIVVHIADYDPLSDGNPDNDLNLITLNAGVNSTVPLRVRVWIANKDLNPNSNLIDDSTLPWTPGVHNWTGGITVSLAVSSTTSVAWPALRDVTRLNANISHNFNPNTSNALIPLANGDESIDLGSIIRLNTTGKEDFESDDDAGQINRFFRGRFNYTPIGQPPASTDNAVGYIAARHRLWGAVVAGDTDIGTYPTGQEVLLHDDEPTNGPTLGEMNSGRWHRGRATENGPAFSVSSGR